MPRSSAKPPEGAMVITLRLILYVLIVAVWITPHVTLAEPRLLALSFDDAPRTDGPWYTGAERTRRLIDCLASVGAEGAMFFVTTAFIERFDPERSRLNAYVQAGHVLANHTHTHPWLRNTSAGDYLADVDYAQNLLSGMQGFVPYFRFPYLDEGRSAAKRDAVRIGLQARGLNHGYVTVDNYDWYMQALVSEAVREGLAIDEARLGEAYVELLIESIEFYDQLAQTHLGRSPRHVLLLHENDLAARYIDDLVLALRDRGWTLIPAVEAYDDPLASRLPDTTFNGQGRVAALAHEQGVPARDLIHPSEDEAWLRQEFERRQIVHWPELAGPEAE
ncbi:MAG: polysaccharide deacetylase family protein [Pseudomonadota bacterium]